MTAPDVAAAAGTIREYLHEERIEFGEAETGSFVVNLPGERRLKTACWLTVTTREVRIEAFVLRRPDENAAGVHSWLLAHNARNYLLSWSIDEVGDIYLTGGLPLAAVSSLELDRVLGVVLDCSDSAFNVLLQLGFGSAIHREWAWRTRRGESLANLAPFEGFLRRPR